MKKLSLLLLIFPFTNRITAQPANCNFKQLRTTIHFGSGNAQDLNQQSLQNYERVDSYCPTDGHYTLTSYTSGCFRNDWFTVTEDHTAGDVDGNMMLVNGSHGGGEFFNTTINGLRGGTTYEFGAWLLNLCKITEKCPFPLLPAITIRLSTPEGKMVARFSTGELLRREAPVWKQYTAQFSTPASVTVLNLSMSDDAPGGCGNDFALDDITFKECIPPKPISRAEPKSAAVVKKQPVTTKPVRTKAAAPPVKKQAVVVETVKPPVDSTKRSPITKAAPPVLPTAPAVLKTRSNPLVQQIETEAGEVRLDLYDNGDIDGDTVSIYHNNVLAVSHARLTQKAISFKILVDPTHPHHEVVMVADNLGSIPPNTSMMVVTSGNKRYEVFISSNEQKNAKVVLELKK